jgi:hypothetical protein
MMPVRAFTHIRKDPGNESDRAGVEGLGSWMNSDDLHHVGGYLQT